MSSLTIGKNVDRYQKKKQKKIIHFFHNKNECLLIKYVDRRSEQGIDAVCNDNYPRPLQVLGEFNDQERPYK